VIPAQRSPSPTVIPDERSEIRNPTPSAAGAARLIMNDKWFQNLSKQVVNGSDAPFSGSGAQMEAIF
jgi:hypothetical protein